MNLIGWFLFFFGLIRLVVSFINWRSRLYLPDVSEETLSPDAAERPLVSILIPARNEEQHIGLLLEDLAAVSYRPLEILVYDDHSTDQTATIVRRFAALYPHIRLLEGSPLPAGWMGKNFACHQLGTHAKGEKRLFLDADVRVGKKIIEKSLAYMGKHRLALLSLFPTQCLPTVGSRLSVPLMNWILLSLLPLPFVRLSKHPALAAANGQFLLFDAAPYDRLHPHRLVKGNRVEDIAIIRIYKAGNYPVATLLGGKDVRCTMYTRLREAIDGFSKNIFQFFGGSALLAFLFALTTTIAPFYIYAVNGVRAGSLYLLFILWNHLFVSWASCQSAGRNLLFLLPRQAVLWVILFSAFLKKKRKTLSWKGRNVSGVERSR